MQNRRLKMRLTVLVVVAIVGAIAIYFARNVVDDHANEQRRHSVQKRLKKNRPVADAKKPTIKEKDRSKRGPKPEFEFDSVKHPYSAEDKRLAIAIQEALDLDDYDAVLKATEVALKADNPDVRLNAVEALGWYGEQALPELTTCMADPDEEVAYAAMGHWELGVSELEDATEKIQVALYALNTITDDDTLAMVSAHFSNAALELIDGTADVDIADAKRLEVVQALVDVIESGKENGAKAACEAYEDITGSKWLGIDEAEKYLADPDNYESPKSADDDD